jgi:hypothetical protein
MVWTQGTNAGVDPANVNTFRYNINADNKMHLMLDTIDGVISGTTTNAFLAVHIPGGRTSRNTVTSPCLAHDSGTASGNWESCYVIETEDSPWLLIRRSSEANWTAQSHLRLDLNIEIELQPVG